MELKNIKGIGDVTLKALNNVNIYNDLDLLYSFPKEYEIYEIDNTLVFSGEYTTVNIQIITQPVFIKYKANVSSIIFYANILNTKVKCVLFSSDYMKYKLKVNLNLCVYGKYKNNEFFIKKLFFENITSKVDVDYKLKNVYNKTMSNAIKFIFDNNIILNETLPLEILDKYKLYQVAKYIYSSHFPNNKEEVRQVIRRRKYEDFFWYAIKLINLKRLKQNIARDKREISNELVNKFYSLIPYELTKDQISTINDIKNDLEGIYPMNRLIQGDVGCGKSIVYLAAVYFTVNLDGQVAIMLPTEVLAQEQYISCKKLFSNENIRIELLTSSVSKVKKKEILNDLINNKINVLIGTHSLIEDSVKFKNLSLAIIDEQHKFGVNQRQRLINKHSLVDAIYLSATPIPRTLGMIEFGDLDISSIHTMPKNRVEIKTKIIDINKMNGLIKFINLELEKGSLIYVVVPSVINNDYKDRIDINSCYEMFNKYFPNVPIGTLHGAMNSQMKEEVMNDFKREEIKILISTTVIEVGVNVVNATTMVIMNAEMFGLAQLHQLRGRVGRGNKPGYCALVTSDVTNDRLMTLEKITDGFSIADEDFKQRGCGDLFGFEQSGFINLEYADFQSDVNIWKCANEDAKKYFPLFLNKTIKSDKFNDIIKLDINSINKIN